MIPLKSKKFAAHFDALIKSYRKLMKSQKYDWIVIPSGMPIRKYLDDMDYPFTVNPHFKALLPLTEHPHCHLIIGKSGKPKVVYYQPVDFWHTVPADPAGDWVNLVTVDIIAEPSMAIKSLPKSGRIVLLGQKDGVLDAVSFSAQNPESLVYPLYWQRAYKSDYEIECVKKANQVACRAHNAARDAFYGGGSELEINFAYLAEAGGQQNDMPYGNIVALNKNASILHYTNCSAVKPKAMHSFLIDAGVQVNGYASDITRTYSYAKNDEFAELISAMDKMHLTLIKAIKPGKSYVELHHQAHLAIADILNQFKLMDMPVEEQVSTGVTGVFFPHGLGHQLGLQVHDVGGHQTKPEGGTTPPPAEYPFLRTTRTIETGQILTIEPGLYFIDSLLDELKQSEYASRVKWNKINKMKKFGGIRIEDNVLVTKSGHKNLTRNAFSKLV